MKVKNILKVSRCLISVSDKTNIIKFSEAMSRENIEIVSTGNTYRRLSAKGIKVKKGILCVNPDSMFVEPQV